MPLQLAIDAHEQVAIECGRHSEWIVVGELQVGLRLDQIGAEQQRVAGRECPANRAQELLRRRRVEVADVRPEQQHQHRAVAGALLGGVAQADFVGLAVADDRDVTEPPERALRLFERLARDVDQVHTGAPPGRLNRFREDHDLLAAAAPELDDQRHGAGNPRDDLRGVHLEQPPLGTGDVIPGQPADCFEQ